MRKIVIYIASSLDGYIATAEHSLDWLFAVDGEGDNGTMKFYDSVDTIIMGRTTYDWIMEHEKDNFQYNDKECYVFSRTESGGTEYVTFVNEDVREFSKSLQNKEGKNIWLMGGGELLRGFIAEGLVDEIIVTVAPILLGKGIPLFLNTDNQTRLLLKNTTRYNQFIELHYKVIK